MSDNQVRCEYCGNYFDRGLDNCSTCNFPAKGGAVAVPSREGAAKQQKKPLDRRKIFVGIGTLAAVALVGLGFVALGGSDDDPVDPPVAGEPEPTDEQWSFEASSEITDAVAVGETLVALAGGDLLGIDMNGDEAWSVIAPGGATIVSVGQSADVPVVVESSEGVAAYDPASGEELWALGGLTFVADVEQGTLVRAGEGPYGLVDEEGGLVWRVETNTQVAVASDNTFVLTGGTVGGYDIERGGQAWEIDVPAALGAPAQISMAASDRTLMLGNNGVLVALDGDTGEELYRTNAGPNPTLARFSGQLVGSLTQGGELTLYDMVGETVSVDDRSGEASADAFESFTVDGEEFVIDADGGAVYDAQGVALAEDLPGAIFPGLTGYFVLNGSSVEHYAPSATSPDYTLPAEPDARVVVGGAVRAVVTGAQVTGY